MKNNIFWIIKRDDFKERYIITDPAGCILDDANHYGFRSYEKAYNYAYNKYKCEPFVNTRLKSNILF